jgi:hypothetical protein
VRIRDKEDRDMVGETLWVRVVSEGPMQKMGIVGRAGDVVGRGRLWAVLVWPGSFPLVSFCGTIVIVVVSVVDLFLLGDITSEEIV